MTARQECFYLIQVAVGFIALGYLSNPWIALVAGFILFGLPFRRARGVIIRAWQNLGLLLGNLVSPIILSVIYYLFLTPLAWLKRGLGSDDLQLKRPEKSTLRSINEVHPLAKFDDLW